MALKGGILSSIHRVEEVLLRYCDEKVYKLMHKMRIYQKEKKYYFFNFLCTITVPDNPKTVS